MRLRLFDRVRRLTHRTPLSETGPAASGAQGRHRRAKRRSPAEPVRPIGMTAGSAESAGASPGLSPAPEEWFTAGEPTAPGAWPVAPPDGSPVAEVPSAPGPPAVPSLPLIHPPLGSAGHPGSTGAVPEPGSRRPSRAHGPSAVRAGSARAQIREAPPDAVGFGEVARPAPAAELARYAAGGPRQ